VLKSDDLYYRNFFKKKRRNYRENYQSIGRSQQNIGPQERLFFFLRHDHYSARSLKQEVELPRKGPGISQPFVTNNSFKRFMISSHLMGCAQ
jgi:hypothetical protein